MDQLFQALDHMNRTQRELIIIVLAFGLGNFHCFFWQVVSTLNRRSR